MRLAFADEGPGPAVVLLHGFPLSGAMWKEQVAGVGSIYRLIVPDLRGHGASPAPEGVYTMDEMADDVIELLDTLSLDTPVVVGGLSMGGYVALSLVLRYPGRVRGLILMDTRAGADSPEAAQKREELAESVIAAGNAGPVVESMMPRLFAKMTLEQRPERVALLREVMENTTPRGIAGALRGMACRPDRRGDLASIAVPTLVLVGEEDVITPPIEAQALADAIPGARLEVVSNSGHMAPYENPAIANPVILRFLEGLDR
ncbi:MAG: alpha/beta fold hydrolase [Isosphaeraceae bacterium]